MVVVGEVLSERVSGAAAGRASVSNSHPDLVSLARTRHPLAVRYLQLVVRETGDHTHAGHAQQHASNPTHRCLSVLESEAEKTATALVAHDWGDF